MEAADVKRLKALELENSRLKKLLAERDLDIEILKEINAKNGEFAGSARTACLRACTGLESVSLLRAACYLACHAQLPASLANQGCTGDCGDEGALGPVPALLSIILQVDGLRCVYAGIRIEADSWRCRGCAAAARSGRVRCSWRTRTSVAATPGRTSAARSP